MNTNDQSGKINVKAFKSLLSNCYLNGLINECVLAVKSDVGLIEAIDPTSCILISLKKKIGDIGDAEIGLKELGMLHKLFSTIDQETVDFKISESWLSISIKGRGKVKMLLADTEKISTALSKPNVKKEILKQSNLSFEVKQKPIEDFKYFIGLFQNSSCTISVKENRVKVKSGEGETNVFNIPFGKFKNNSKTFDVTVNGEHLNGILNVLEFNKNSEKIYFHVGNENSPIAIVQGKYFFSLTPSGI